MKWRYEYPELEIELEADDIICASSLEDAGGEFGGTDVDDEL